ncbi:hypothetical protein BJ912DRAFT_129255 [Pholiota molesta]|nr:hypothetical protein BJ912DRAFT_129255 [Pholiota molesta]
MASENGPETQYFPNLSKSVINNPTITHVSGDMYSSSSPERYGLKLLLDNISVGAFHDAAERGDPPRCYPRTRTAIRSEIMEWIKAPNALRKLILWMHGPAGSGKTAIAQSIAEECKKKGLLAASFFFGRTAAGRNDSSRFIATIAYQLSQSIPEICEQMISAVEHNPTIFSLTLATQMQVLLVEPLKSLPPRSKPIFVITDGVDECGPDRNSQTKLLNLIATLISELQDIPFIFLISCRPEYEIREAFNGNSLSPIYKSLVLDDNYKPGKDIKLYLSSTFQEICNKHRRLGSRLPDPWPATADVDVIASKASGQFIFAVTVMKFVDSSRHDPQERLHDILHLSAPRNETPFAFLDTLYCSILSSVTDLSKVLDVLTLLILGDYPRIGIFPPILLTIEVAEALLGFAIGPVLVDMHALVFVPSDHDSAVFHSELRIHHASLYDFLTDESRSHEYYIDITQGNIELSRRWLKKIVDYYRRPLTPVLPPRLHFVDCINGFAIQCAKINTTSTAIADDLASLSLTQFLEEIRGDGHVYHAEWYDFFACVQGRH